MQKQTDKERNEKARKYSAKYYAEHPEYFRKHYQENKERHNILTKKYYAENKGRQQELYMKNRQKILERRREYRVKNHKKIREAAKEHIKRTNRAHPERIPLSVIKSKNKSFGITADYAKIKAVLIEQLNRKYCTCCGIKYDKSDRNRIQTVDRVDNDLGYLSDNIQVICGRCNTLKRDAMLGDIENIHRYMIKHSPTINKYR